MSDTPPGPDPAPNGRDRLARGAAVLCVVIACVLLAGAVVQATPGGGAGSNGSSFETRSVFPGDRTSGLERLRSIHEVDDEGRGTATLEGHAASEFEALAFDDGGQGQIEPDPEWVEEHIVTADVPLLDGPVRCNEVLLPQLEGALAELEERDLGHLIDPAEYGGCWVPRHIMHEPDRALSLHAWGLAVDLNVATNPYGAEPQMDERVVDVFERWGFAWGGHWRTPDGMHFELLEVRDEPRP